MDERTDGISRRQLSMLLFVSALSPLIRQAPGMAVQSAGSAVWLSALLALVPLPLAGLLLGRLTRKRVPGEGLGGVLLRVLGRFGGTAAVLLYTAWTVFYAGFVLRAGADRFVTAVYPGSRPWLFMAVMAALCVPACLGRLKTLGRCAEIALPLLALGLLAALLCVTVVATFGAKLTAEMHFPFFVMIRCIRIFRLLERVEALVVAQWVTTDFLLLGALLQAATGELTLCFPKLGARRGAVALTCLALALLSGALCASTSFSLRELSRTLVPVASASAAGVLVLAFVVGLIRKKI